MSLTPADAKLRAQLGAHAKWAKTANRTEATEPAREGFDRSLARQYGIPEDLPPEQYAARLKSARKAHFAKLALKSARARRLAAEVRQLAAEVEAETA